MIKSPILEFECDTFPVQPGEDSETNPGVYGKSLAILLGDRLREAGVVTSPVIAKDFGWLVPIKSGKHSLFVACTNGNELDSWRVFVFQHRKLIFQLFDKQSDAVEVMFQTVRRLLASDSRIREMKQVQY